jgi:hypothetical protein
MPVHRDSELAHMVEHFYGYGRWDAPFWFVGPEAGMGKDGRDRRRAYQAVASGREH